MLILALMVCSIIGFIYDFRIYEYKGTATAIDAYINFASITIGFLATVISMLFVLVKQDFMKEVLAKKESKQDFIMLGSISILTGFISIILAVILTFIIANGNVVGTFSKSISIILIDVIIIYIVNVVLFLLVNLISIFVDV